MIVNLEGKIPVLSPHVFLAPTATVIGDVTIGEHTSIWYGCILRGDVHSIRIGSRCNIQDGTIMHGMYQKWNVVVEDEASIGHGVILHGCRIGKGSLVGMGSLVMDGAVVVAGTLVGAGSLVPEGTLIAPGWLAMGRPAKAIRPLKDEETAFLKRTTENYLMYAGWYKSEEKS